jgi:hypothetical protein
MILNAGADRAGQRWSFAFSFGHSQGLGPLAGLGSDVVTNWLAFGSTPPFFGFLDGNGSARLDFPAGTLGAGVAADFIFVLQDGLLQTAPVTSVSNILEFDS